MTDALAHRGPDDEGVYVAGPIGLGHRRLAIIDPAHGRQPMQTADGRYTLVYNGEIYNYRELRARLENEGVAFRTHTDTEVLLELLAREGPAALRHLRGMFAFALWDHQERELLCARDPLGQKPLFYVHRGDVFWFASEIKSLLAVDAAPRRIDAESVHHFLSLRFIPAPRTMLEAVRKLPPAHWLRLRDGALHIERYWSPSFEPKHSAPEAELLEALDAHLADAVAAHTIADVDVGAYLSGGMDSSMVVALMARGLKRRFHTFSVGVEDASYNELPWARMVAEACGTEHIERVVAEDVISLLPAMIWHLDEPSDPIAACMYHAARLASEHVKVVLGGDGGDELMAGYDRYLGVQRLGWLAGWPAWLRSALLDPLVALVPDSFAYKSFGAKLRWVQRLARFSDCARRFAEATTVFRFTHDDKRRLYGEAHRRRFGGLNSAEVMTASFAAADAREPLDRMLAADMQTRLAEHSLMLTDRLSMAFGLEVRSPLLDTPLVEFANRLPADLKIRGSTLKYALRQVARRHLPEPILRRPKQGFMFPVASWFRDRLHGLLRSWLPDGAFVRDGWFRRDAIERLLDEHRAGAADHHVRLWMLLNLELWRRMVVDRDDPGTLREALRANVGCSSDDGAATHGILAVTAGVRAQGDSS